KKTVEKTFTYMCFYSLFSFDTTSTPLSGGCGICFYSLFSFDRMLEERREEVLKACFYSLFSFDKP
ncbi:MAG: hypothetical protein RMJ00_07180, partial [Nitrososphaerota archaeon]|nr:hypothetical protein [Nitrososphaerota archaeon]